MSEHSEARPHHGEGSGHASIPWVVLAAVLIGAGVFILTYALTFFDLIFLLGAIPVLIGGLMLFDRRPGADHA